jgi:hypothetical protein
MTPFESAEEIEPGYYRIEDPVRSGALSKIILDRVVAAGGDKEAWMVTDQGTDLVPIRIRMSWTISGEWVSREYKGDQSQGCINVKGVEAVKSTAQYKCSDLVNNGDAAEAFLKEVDRGAMDLLSAVTCQIQLNVTAAIAYIYSCHFCNGRGVFCCSSCGGTGSTLQVVTRYDIKGQAYSVTESKTCLGCNGRGFTVCSACGGHGKTTYRADITTHASSECEISYANTVSDGPLGPILKGLSFDEILHYVPMTFKGVVKVGAEIFDLIYDGVAKATSVLVNSKGLSYTVIGFGPKNCLYKPPPVLDPLLKSITKYAEISCQKRKAKNLACFQCMLKIPLLQKTLNKYASTSKDMSALIAEEGQGLISDEITSRLGEASTKIVEGICPSYSLLPWVIFVFIGGALAHFEGIIGTAGSPNFLLFLGAGAMAFLVPAKIYTAFRRRMIPKDYRTPTLESRPFVISFVLVIGIFFASWFLPSSERSYLVNTYLDQLYTIIPCDLKLVTDMHQTSRWVQQRLATYGFYRGPIDGQFGPISQAALRQFQRAKKIAVTGKLDRDTLCALRLNRLKLKSILAH